MAKRKPSTARAGQTGKRKKLKIDKEALKDLGPQGADDVKGGTGYVAYSTSSVVRYNTYGCASQVGLSVVRSSVGSGSIPSGHTSF